MIEEDGGRSLGCSFPALLSWSRIQRLLFVIYLAFLSKGHHDFRINSVASAKDKGVKCVHKSRKRRESMLHMHLLTAVNLAMLLLLRLMETSSAVRFCSKPTIMTSSMWILSSFSFHIFGLATIDAVSMLGSCPSRFFYPFFDKDVHVLYSRHAAHTSRQLIDLFSASVWFVNIP